MYLEMATKFYAVTSKNCGAKECKGFEYCVHSVIKPKRCLKCSRICSHQHVNRMDCHCQQCSKYNCYYWVVANKEQPMDTS